MYICSILSITSGSTHLQTGPYHPIPSISSHPETCLLSCSLSIPRLWLPPHRPLPCALDGSSTQHACDVHHSVKVTALPSSLSPSARRRWYTTRLRDQSIVQPCKQTDRHKHADTTALYIRYTTFWKAVIMYNGTINAQNRKAIRLNC